MAKYRMVRTDFWKNPIVMEEMTPEDKYFYLYLLTNPHTTQTGIYRITKKQMAFDLGYSIESVHSLMDCFILHHKLIRYNPETRELAIKYWGKENLAKGGKPVVDCIISELKEVEDLSLILYVSEFIPKADIRSLLSIADRMSRQCGFLSHCLRTTEPVNAEREPLLLKGGTAIEMVLSLISMAADSI